MAFPSPPEPDTSIHVKASSSAQYCINSLILRPTYIATIAATTPRNKADSEAATETAPPVKGATEVFDPEPAPEADATPDAVPAGALVVEAVG